MILKSKQTFDKVMLDRLDSDDFLDFLSHATRRELVNKLMDNLQDHKMHFVKLGEPWTEDENTYGTLAYRQELICETIVQCKNCRMNFPWCQKFRDELGGNGFCPYGAEIIDEDEQKRICLSCEDCRHDGVKHAYDYACDKCTDMDKWESD